MKYVLAGLLVVAACARPYPPSGGEQDREAPRVMATTPAHESVIPGFNQEVVFEFDEGLSERGLLDVVLVSPESGEVEVERDGNKLKIKVEGGWKPNTIYRVVVAPTIQDRQGNVRKEPAEIVFSTGPPLVPTAIAGAITDRITGRPTAGVRVEVTGARDSARHVTLTDSAGFFGLRFLPLDRYTVQAFEDANRNRKLDFSEKVAQQIVNIGTVRDTQIVELSVLARDTTPARLLRAEARDSLDVRLTFDDYIDPDQPANTVTAVLFVLPDSTPGPTAVVWSVRDYERMRAIADSLKRVRADTTRADTTRRVPQIRPQLQPVTPGAPAGADTTRILPRHFLVLVPVAPLTPRTRYRVVVRNVRNITGIAAGGGSATFTTRARPGTDSTNVRRDTATVRRDTVGISRRLH